MTRTRLGFTLVEVLVVCAVLSLLSAILLPVFNKARTAGRRATSTSYLRQCGMALRLYCDDNGGDRSMPTGSVAPQVLKNAPTCDPGDTWRENCEHNFGSPLIGSYAYVREVDGFKTQQDWDDTVARRPSGQQPLMVSIYYADVVPDAFQGMQPDLKKNDLKPLTYYMPNRILRLNMDGSVSSSGVLLGYSGGKPQGQFLMNWPHIFADFELNTPMTTFPAPQPKSN